MTDRQTRDRRLRSWVVWLAAFVMAGSLLADMRATASSAPAQTAGTPAQIFSLGFAYQGQAYTAVVYGDQATYASVVSSQAGHGAVAAQATYLVGSVQGSYPLYAITVFPGVPGDYVGPQVTGQLRTTILAGVFTWAYVYVDIYIPDRSTTGNTAAESFVAALEAGPISQQWRQQLGIDAAALLDYLTIVGPLVRSAEKLWGLGGAALIGDFVSLLAAIVQNNYDGSFSDEWSSILSTLEANGLIPGPGFTGTQFLQGLASYPASQLPALVTTLFADAFPGQTIPPSLTSTLVDVALKAAEGTAQSTVVTTAEVYFGAQAAGLSSFVPSALTTAEYAAADDIVGTEIPLGLASVLNSQIVQPEAYALQEEVNLQDIEVSMLRQFNAARQALGADIPANISLETGNELADIDGLMLAFGVRWSSVDDALVQTETLRCAIIPDSCTSQETTDQNFAAQLTSWLTGLESYQQDAQTLIANLPSGALAFAVGGTLPGAMAGQAYAATIGVTGGTAPYAWAASGMPSWLSLDSSTGALSGTPPGAGWWTFTVQVTDSGSPAQQVSGSFTVTAAPDTLSITTSSLPAGIVGSGYSATLHAQGGTAPYTWTITSGNLQTGLSFSSGGVLSGTPTSSGTAQLTFKVTDATTPAPQTATAVLSLTIAPATLAITTTSLPGGTLGSGYVQDLNAQGGVTPYQWSLVSGTLPPGTHLGTENSAVGDIAGVPARAGTFTFTIGVTDSESPPASASQQLSITITPASLTITTTALAPATQAEAYSAGIATTGGNLPLGFTVSSGALPAGLQLNAQTGAITGAPGKPGTFSFTIKVTDAGTPAQVATFPYTLVVAAHPLAVTTGYLPAAFSGAGYGAGLSADWGTPPYTWAITSGTLFPGLAFSTTTGAITGTPTNTGTRHLTFTVTDSTSPAHTASRALALTVLPASDALSPRPMPVDATSGDSLGSVSCPTATWCMAVGQTTSYGLQVTERLSGGHWQLLPAPAGLANANAQLDGVSCVSTTFCIAVGHYRAAGGAQNLTLAEGWNGTSWAQLASPDVGSGDNFLSGVSCTSASFCIAVGNYRSQPSGTQTNLAETWDGSSWTTMSPPSLGVAGALTAVSCTAQGSFCSVTGNYFPGGGAAQTGVVMTWNGSWTADSSLPGNTTDITGVSCAAASFCAAAGYGAPSGGGSDYPVGFIWNGTGWSATMTSFQNGGLYGQLAGISCPSTTSCEAVGVDYDQGGSGGALVIYYHSGIWTAVPGPSDVSGAGTSLASIACGRTSCTAVGALDGTPFADMTGSAPAPPPAAKISSFTVAPGTLPATGGQLTFTWSASHASACVITSAPALNGLPTDVACSAGTGTVTVPANTSNPPSTITYEFQLSAIGSDGTAPATSSAGPVAQPGAGLNLTWAPEVPLPGAELGSGSSNISCSSPSDCAVPGLTPSNTDAVWTTTNSGTSWSESTVPNTSYGRPTCLATLGFYRPCLIAASSQNLYLIGYATAQQSVALWVSANGGGSWNQESLPDNLYSNFALACPGPMTCYLATGPLNFYETTNGGITWNGVAGNLKSVATGSPYQLVCYSLQACILAAGGGVVVTTDGGSDWTAVSQTANEVQCLDATHCFLNNGNGLEFSGDGGFTWNPLGNSPPQTNITEFSCASATICAVVSNNEFVYSTADGGQSWNTITPTSPCYEGSCGGAPSIWDILVATATGPVYANGLDGNSGQRVIWTGTISQSNAKKRRNVTVSGYRLH